MLTPSISTAVFSAWFNRPGDNNAIPQKNNKKTVMPKNACLKTKSQLTGHVLNNARAYWLEEVDVDIRDVLDLMLHFHFEKASP